MKLKRLISLFIIAIFALGMLSSCGSTEENSEDTSIKVTLCFYDTEYNRVIFVEEGKVSKAGVTVAQAIREIDADKTFFSVTFDDEDNPTEIKNVIDFEEKEYPYEQGKLFWIHYKNIVGADNDKMNDPEEMAKIFEEATEGETIENDTVKDGDVIFLLYKNLTEAEPDAAESGN